MSAIVAIIKTDADKYWLMLAKEEEGNGFCILGWDSMARGVNYFEEAYNRAHSRGYEPSMSACINFVQLQPKVVAFDSIEDLEKKLLPKGACRSPHRLSTVSGSYDVLPLDSKLAAPIYAAGRTPNLITR